MLTVRPIHYTTRAGDWRDLFVAAGARDLGGDDSWRVLALPGGGRVALHGAGPGSPQDGTVEVAFETADLDTYEAAHAAPIAAAGGRLERSTEEHGEALRLTLPDGTFVLIDAATADPGAAGEATGARHAVTAVTTATASAPLVVTRSPTAVSAVLAAAGLTPRLSSAGGGWHDFTADGVIGVHAASNLTSEAPSSPPAGADGPTGGQRPAGATGGLEHPDVDALAEHLRAAGVRCDVVDEAYARTLLVENPDFPEDPAAEADLPGKRLWVCETQTDTYGYTDHRAG